METSLRDVLAPIKINSVRHFFIVVKTNSLIDGIKKWKEILEQEAANDQPKITIRVQKNAPGLPGQIEKVLLSLSMPEENLSMTGIDAKKIHATHFEILVSLDSALHGDWIIVCEVTMQFVNHKNETEQTLLMETFSAKWPPQDSIIWTISVEGAGLDIEGDPQYLLKMT